ncbi:hypothetical protein Tco_0670653 [Tanacetum coccineum]
MGGLGLSLENERFMSDTGCYGLNIITGNVANYLYIVFNYVIASGVMSLGCKRNYILWMSGSVALLTGKVIKHEVAKVNTSRTLIRNRPNLGGDVTDSVSRARGAARAPIFHGSHRLQFSVLCPKEPERHTSPIYPLPVAASPTTESPGYIPEFRSVEDHRVRMPEEDPEEDPADFPADRGDDRMDEEPSDDDDDTPNHTLQ